LVKFTAHLANGIWPVKIPLQQPLNVFLWEILRELGITWRHGTTGKTVNRT